jgi:hypothetical protein
MRRADLSFESDEVNQGGDDLDLSVLVLRGACLCRIPVRVKL